VATDVKADLIIPSHWGTILLTWRLNSQLRHAGRDPASSLFLDSRLRGNDNPRVFNCRSNKDLLPFIRYYILSLGLLFKLIQLVRI
jgi:hypothetical protein